MKYEEFKSIFNENIFEESKATLLKKVARSPSRYVGLFRPTKPKTKLIQNLSQSHEIRFGDAFEDIIEEYFKSFGFVILEKKFSTEDGDRLNVDQCFRDENFVYFIEQKMRDDHDSTKKRGQIENFKKKLKCVKKEHGKNVKGFFYFVDPALKKNKSYYRRELRVLGKKEDSELKLFYGKELFKFLRQEDSWEEILSHLKRWKKELPDFPETNFDKNPQVSFEEIKNLSPNVFRKIFENKKVFDEIILTIFPKKRTLYLLLDYFKKNKSKKGRKELVKLLSDRLSQ